ncbi:MAG: hypothetical protein M3065_22300 [Actinomycetota bacterium]|nr:hypothetical protein [Actinomycetota bacterium]
MLHALAVVFALVAVAFMILAIAGMVTGRPSARFGWIVRVLAVLCFAAAVVLNVAAH